MNIIIGRPSGMETTDYKCLSCGAQILENTSSTTTCVKCARIRTRRLNFAHPPAPTLSSATAEATTAWANSSQATAGCLPPPQQQLHQHLPPAHISFCSWDSRDSGVSSQDSDLTPTIERSHPQLTPQFPANMAGASAHLNEKLVQKLSEVEGKA